MYIEVYLRVQKTFCSAEWGRKKSRKRVGRDELVGGSLAVRRPVASVLTAGSRVERSMYNYVHSRVTAVPRFSRLNTIVIPEK